MLYLWIFGDNVEDALGRNRFILFYILCGIAAALAQAAINPSSSIPMVGASGGIAGVLGAYLILHPKAAVRCILIIFVFFVLSIYQHGLFSADGLAYNLPLHLRPSGR